MHLIGYIWAITVQGQVSQLSLSTPYSTKQRSVPQYHGPYHNTTVCTTIPWSVPQYHGLYHNTIVCTTIPWSVPRYHGLYHNTTVCSTIPWSVPQYYGLFHNTIVCTTILLSVPQYHGLYHNTTVHSTIPRSFPQYNGPYHITVGRRWLRLELSHQGPYLRTTSRGIPTNVWCGLQAGRFQLSRHDFLQENLKFRWLWTPQCGVCKLETWYRRRRHSFL